MSEGPIVPLEKRGIRLNKETNVRFHLLANKQNSRPSVREMGSGIAVSFKRCQMNHIGIPEKCSRGIGKYEKFYQSLWKKAVLNSKREVRPRLL